MRKYEKKDKQEPQGERIEKKEKKNPSREEYSVALLCWISNTAEMISFAVLGREGEEEEDIGERQTKTKKAQRKRNIWSIVSKFLGGVFSLLSEIFFHIFFLFLLCSFLLLLL